MVPWWTASVLLPGVQFLVQPTHLILGWTAYVLLRNIMWSKWQLITSRWGYGSLWFLLFLSPVLLFPLCLLTLMKQLPRCKRQCTEGHVTRSWGKPPANSSGETEDSVPRPQGTELFLQPQAWTWKKRPQVSAQKRTTPWLWPVRDPGSVSDSWPTKTVE